MDTFASIDAECGTISSSQEEHLLHSLFLNESSSSSPSDGGATAPRRLEPADQPIMFCSVPDSPAPNSAAATTAEAAAEATSAAASGEGLGPSSSAAVQDSTKGTGTSPAVAEREQRLGFRGPRRMKSRAYRRRSGGSKIEPPEDSPPETDPDPVAVVEIENFRYQSLEVLKDVFGDASGVALPPRKLPASILNRRTAEEEEGRGRGVVPSDPIPAFPADLLDVIITYSGKPNRRFQNTDILDIAKMKGIEFPPPKWWRPAGYEAKTDEAPE